MTKKTEALMPGPVSPTMAELSPAMIEAAIRNGRRLRALAIRRAFSGLGQGMRRFFRPAGIPPRSRAVPRREGDVRIDSFATEMQGPLIAIRSAAEILRDSPTLSPDERNRFAGIVLAEEGRLEALVGRLLALRQDGRLAG